MRASHLSIHFEEFSATPARQLSPNPDSDAETLGGDTEPDLAVGMLKIRSPMARRQRCHQPAYELDKNVRSDFLKGVTCRSTI